MRNLERNIVSNGKNPDTLALPKSQPKSTASDSTLIWQEPRLTRQRPSQNGHGSMTEVVVREERVDIDDIEDRKLENLSELSLHLRDIERFSIQKEKHARWGEEVFAGKIAIKALSILSQSEIISTSQREKVMQALEKGKFLLNRLDLRINLVQKRLERDKYENEQAREYDREYIEMIMSNEELANEILDSARSTESEDERDTVLDQFIGRWTNFANQGLESWDNLVRANLRLVVSIAKIYQYRGVDLPDLIGYGHEGLVIAAADFDSKKGFQFSTYATFWIKQKITKSIIDYGSMIRLPVYVHKEVNSGIKAQDRDLQEGKHSDLPEKLRHLLRFRTVYSLDEPTTDDDEEDRTLRDKIHNNEDQNVEDIAQKSLLVDAAKEVLATLTDRQRRVIQLRFGFDDGESKSLEEVGREFGVTRERIRQIESQALKKLRHDTRSRMLRPFLKDE